MPAAPKEYEHILVSARSIGTSPDNTPLRSRIPSRTSSLWAVAALAGQRAGGGRGADRTDAPTPKPVPPDASGTGGLPARHGAAARCVSDEPVLAGLAAAAWMADLPSRPPTGLADEQAAVPIGVHEAVARLAVVRQRAGGLASRSTARQIDSSTFDSSSRLRCGWHLLPGRPGGGGMDVLVCALALFVLSRPTARGGDRQAMSACATSERPARRP